MHYKQYFATCNSNLLLRASGNVLPMKVSARQIVAKNLKRLMEESATLDTQAKVAAKSGLTQRAIGYLLNPSTTDMKSPKLDTVEKVARAFQLEPWMLLIDQASFGQELGKVMLRPPVPDKRLDELGSQPPIGKPPAVRGKRGKKSLV